MFIDRETAYRLELGHAMRSYYYTEAHGQLKPAAQVELRRISGGVVMYGGPGSQLNRAMAFGFSAGETLQVIDAVEDFFRSHGEATCFEACPLAEPAFIKALYQRGYRLEKFLNVLACRLPDEVAPIRQPSEVDVRRATPEESELWIYTTAQGFDESEVPSSYELESTAPNFYSRNAECYLAWVDGQPAGAGGMYAYQGVVELGSASTRPAYRRRGVQTALLLQRLQDARAGGNDLALATTQPGTDSQRNMERVGMRLAYSKARLKSTNK